MISVCAAPKGMDFESFWSENEYRLCPFWSGIGYSFRGTYGSVWTYLSIGSNWIRNKPMIWEFGESGRTPPPSIPRNTPKGKNHLTQLKHFRIRTCSSKENLLNKMEEFQRHLRVAGRLSKNLRRLICLCNALWKLKEGMAPTSRLDAGRKARLFDMKRPVVHTRNNYFFKAEHCCFFHLLIKDWSDAY